MCPGSIPGADIYLGMYQPPRSTQPGHPFVVGTESTSQMAVMPSGWGVRAGMVRVWVTGKTVLSSCYTRAISELFRVRAQ